ncbi:MAG TPA: lipid-transfer protein [Candidatus Dormibacteraeota bacterium]|nr:lipid-transfer protein [Candidatus Dormibacteraeota bacterium]
MSDGIERDLFRRIQDRMAIVGIGHLPFAKDIGRPIGDTAVEAIQLALEDAGLDNEDVDGISMFEMEHTHEVSIARRLGVKNLRWWDKISYGGGASCATIMHACAAIASGLAEVVVCHRARNRGAKTSRPWSQEKGLVIDDKALHVPWGLIRPVDVIGMWAHRHMHDYGTTREQLGNVAIAARKHAQRNPYAMMRDRPLDMATYLAGRVIGYPLTLFDCCLETDGALACVVTSVERARDLKQKPVLVHAVAQASGPNPVHLANYNTPGMRTTAVACAELLWSRSQLQPADMDCAQIYDAFTPLVIMGLEDYGFCARGEGGPFTENGRIELGGALPVLTSGGGLSEAYVHGFNLILEAVRQIRGTSWNQVPDCKATLVTGASGVATSAMVVRGE